MPNDDDFPIIPHLLLSDEEIINQMISYYREKYEGGSSPIRDFFEGSQIRNILGSTSIEGSQLRFLINLMLKMGFVNYAKRGWLDLLGEERNVFRFSAINSKGFLLFTYPADEVEENEEAGQGDDEPIIIPAYTYVAPSKDSSLEYETLEDAVILPGGSVTVPAQCVKGGVQGNIGSRKIDTIIDDNDELWNLEVINPQPFTGGEEEEDDDGYRERIKIKQKERGTVGKVSWYKSEAEQIEGVHDVLVINNPNEKFTVSLIINGKVKPTPLSVIDSVMAFFNNDDNRIGGTDVFVTLVETVSVSFQSACTINNNYDEEEVKETIQNDIKCLLEGGTSSNGTEHPGLRIGESLSLNQVYNVLLNVEGLTSFYLTLPSQDVQVSPDKVLVLGEIDLLA